MTRMIFRQSPPYRQPAPLARQLDGPAKA